jgi:competence protein ComFB
MYELKNHTESVVHQTLKEYLEKYELPCGCDRCQADIKALALNQLPSKYYVSLRGEILTHWESQGTPDQARVMSAIVRAAKQVGGTPSHP